MKKDIVTIKCGGRTEQMPRKEAIKKYAEGMAWSEGSERDRYADIYCQLVAGCKVCSDEIW